MKRIIIALAAALMVSATAQAQLKFGVRAGYGLNNASWYVKGASAKLNLGINHGFYVGPEARMNLGDMFGVSAGLQFEQMGTKYKADAAKTSENTTKTELLNKNLERNALEETSLSSVISSTRYSF